MALRGRLRWTPRRLALLAFCGHAPGIWLVSGARLTPALARVNLVALALTLAAMAGAAAIADEGEGLRALALAWLVGHFLWSAAFAAWILGGGALVLPERSDRTWPLRPGP